MLCLAIFAVHSAYATIRYVNASLTTGSNNGTTWANAYKDLQPALAAAQSGDQIWVAKGTYFPTTSTTDRSATFIMRSNVGIYGGFAGTETLLSQRDWVTNLTTLSGDIDHIADPLIVTGSGATLSITGNSGNSFHVVYSSSTSNIGNTSILDGFTISGGYAYDPSGNVFNGWGGGMLSLGNPSLYNLNFYGNTAYDGGGLILEYTNSSILNNIVFLKNNATAWGGGFENNGGNTTLSNLIFVGNNAGSLGGGMHSEYPVNLTNGVFAGNNSANQGGGIYTLGSLMNITNVTFSSNTSLNGGSAVYNYFGSCRIKNSAFFNNTTYSNTNNIISEIANEKATTTINYTALQFASSNYGSDFTLGSNNFFGQDPQFVSASSPAGADGLFGTADDGLKLQSSSPCINKGNNDSVPAGITTDIAGLPRIIGGTVDMGAYESGYVSPTAFTGCPNVNLAIARPGYNNYNGEPTSMYYVDTATGAATLIPGGPLKSPLTGYNLPINGVGLNSRDGFAYGLNSPEIYRIGSNYVAQKLGNLPSPPLSGTDNLTAVIGAGAGMDDQDNYYFIGITGLYGNTNGTVGLSPNNYYLGKLQNVSTLKPDTVYLNATWTKIDFSNIVCNNFYSYITTFVSSPTSPTVSAFQDITYSNLYRNLYLYTTYLPTGANAYVGQLLSIEPTTGKATCYQSSSFGAPNNEVSGISTTSSGNLRIFTTSGDIYRPVMAANGNFTSALTKIGTSGIPPLSITGSIRGDLASCSVGPASLPSSILPSLPNHIIAYPNPSRGMTTITVGQPLNNATVRLLGIAGNVIAEKSGVSGYTFQMDLTGKPKGIYVVEVNQNGTSQKVKIMRL